MVYSAMCDEHAMIKTIRRNAYRTMLHGLMGGVFSLLAGAALLVPAPAIATPADYGLMCMVVSGSASITQGQNLVQSFQIIRDGQAADALKGLYVSDFIGSDAQAKKYKIPGEIPNVSVKVVMSTPELAESLQKGFYVKSKSQINAAWFTEDWENRVGQPRKVLPTSVNGAELMFALPRTTVAGECKSADPSMDMLWKMKQCRQHLLNRFKNLEVIILKDEHDPDNKAVLIFKLDKFSGRQRP